MKNYTFLLFPQSIDSLKIESLRKAEVGDVLVDNLLPHSTLKRRFTLKNGFNESDLSKILNNFVISKINIVFNKLEILGNAVVMVGENENLKLAHKSMLKLLNEKITTQDPQYEADNFKIHLTLFRDKDIKEEYNKYLGEIVFDRLCLYELDPTPARSWAKQIYCKQLK